VIPAGGEGTVQVHVDVARQDEIAPPETRDLADGVNGIVHLPRLARTDVRADLVLRPGEPVVLSAGELPDGRSVSLEVRAGVEPHR
jgi:hypothetical protein